MSVRITDVPPFHGGQLVFVKGTQRMTRFIRVQHFCGGTDIIVKYDGDQKPTKIAWMPGYDITHYLRSI